MASGPITSWEIDGETVSNFIFGGSKITAVGDCSHEIKKRLLLGRKVMTNLDSILESRALLVPLYYKMSLNSHSWRWFFETLVHNLLGLPAFWIKSLFIAPTIRFLIFYFLCSKQYKFGLSCSFAQLCPSLCDPIDCSMPGFPVHHRLLKFAQTQAHWVGDAIQPSHPLLSPSPAFNLSQHQGLFQCVDSSHQVAKILEIQLQH